MKTIKINGVYFSEVGKNTKKAEQLKWAYEYAKNKNYTSMYDVYKNCSSRKMASFEVCKVMCKDVNGKDLYITSAGCQFFSVGFTFEHENKNYLAYITYANNFIVEL